MSAVVRDIELAFPPTVLENEDLARLSPDWTAGKIFDKTGIARRHVTTADEFASDLAINATQALFQRRNLDPGSIDYLLYCTQSPDYILPTTACLLQDRLGLPKSCGALDINLGCSGFVYGLGLAKGLIESGQASRLLLLCADTYSKYIRADDLSIRTLFGDAGAACLIEAADATESIGPFVYGTDGRGKENLIVRPGGNRGSVEQTSAAACPVLTMNGPEIFSFTSQAVPAAINKLLETAKLSAGDIDYWVFHQASLVVLDHLRKKMKIPAERFANYLENYGNTVSCSIPLALSCALRDGKIQPGSRVALVGFGVGYSWGACILRWT